MRFLGILLTARLALAGDAPQRRWTAFAYPVSFEHITVEQGLSHNTVHCILQDRKGFLWFGTDAGLNRYDGLHVQVFHPEKRNPHSLSGDWILHLMEDHRGYIWIATRNGGVTILDPETMRMTPILASEEPGGLPSKTVNAFAEDRAGNLWLATETHGLCMVSKDWRLPDKPRFQTFTPSPQNPDGPPVGGVNALLYDGKGTLWIASRSRGIGRLVSRAGDANLAFRYYVYNALLPDAHASTIVEDPFGLLWLGGDNGAYTFSPDRGSFQPCRTVAGDPISLGSNHALSIIRDSTGTMWVANDGAGLLKALPRSGPQDPVRFQRFTHDPRDPRSLSGNGLQCVFEDRSGVLWVNSYQGGLNKLVLNNARSQDREIPSIFQYRSSAADLFSLSGNTVATIGEDRFGDLWVGTDGFGLNRVRRPAKPGEPIRFERFAEDRQHGLGRLQSNVILTTHLDPQQVLWFGTYNAGLIRVNQASATAPPSFTHYRNDPKEPTSLSSNFIRCLVDDGSGAFWVATDGGGLNHFDPRTGQARHYGWGNGNHASSSSVLYFMVKDGFGTLWIATPTGLNRFNPATEEFRVYNPGGSGSLGDALINTLYLDGAGTLWVGSSSGGLCKLTVSPWNGPEPRFSAFGTNEGLAGNAVMGILPDGKGNLWLSTDRALCRFNILEGRGHPFTWQSELRRAGFIWNARFVSSTGEMFFGSNDGLTLFHPEDIVPNRIVPPIAISSFQILNSALPLWDRTTQRATDKAVQEITLDPKDSRFSFDFAALHFAAPEQNQYAYMLDGLDLAWNEVGNRHSISYTTLPPGHYQLRIKGSNCDDVWNTEGLKLKIHVLPPWYKTWWCRTLLVGLLLWLVYAIIRVRLKVLNNRNQMLEALVAARTQELADANDALMNQSLTDPLTGLRNRRFLDACMPEDVAQVQRIQREVASTTADRMKLNIDVLFIMVDIDHFKQVNDQHGHHAGDLVLKQVGEILRNAMRNSDTITRWGGEEFLIVARNAARVDATIPAERIRAAMEAHLFDIGEEQPIRCTCSLGFSIFPFLPNETALFSWDRIVEVADACLYTAKRNGRNAWVGIIPNATGMDAASKKSIPKSVPDLVNAQQFPAVTSLKNPIQWEQGQ